MVRWTVLIPAKALGEAKTRLVGTQASDTAQALVDAIRTDTVAAATSCPEVARVMLVVDRASSVTAVPEVFVQSKPGLNPALAEAAEHAAAHWPTDGIAALLGDLPALQPDDLAETLRAAEDVERGFVADATDLGTTLLTARPGVALNPRFGDGSAARHAEIASLLPAGLGLRRDVDTADDLAVALEIGVGPATLAAAHRLSTRSVHLDSA